MPRHLTAEEARAELESALGTELGAAFAELQSDLAWLHIKWRHYRELYGTKPERIELLNETSPMFFRIVEDALWDDTLIHIARLTDHVGKGKQQRLSIRQLPLLIAEDDARTEIDLLVQGAVEAASFARDWRNRRIAHRNFEHALNPKADPLAPASRIAVEQVLHALREVLNFVNGRFRATEMKFDLADHLCDAEELLYVLRDGLAVARDREQALEEGRVGPPDWGVPPAI